MTSRTEARTSYYHAGAGYDNATGWGSFNGANLLADLSVLLVPNAPTIGTAMPGNAQALVAFTAPAFNGSSPITSYTATSNPDSITATGTTSPITVSGLTNGKAYTFTVKATSIVGTSVPSSPSNSVTPAPPIIINNGSPYTTKTTVSLALTYPGATYMQFSTNGTTWTPWGSYAATKSLTLPSGDGLKSVSVRFRDSKMVISDIYFATILLDTKAPAITAIAPTTGTIGTIVTITGKYFGPTQGTSSVSFNGTAVTSYTSWTDTSIKCVVPSGTTTGNVTVTTTEGTSNGKLFTLKPPTITAIAPTTGTIGTIVTITGTYFGPTQGTSSVSFNGTAVTSYTSWTDTSIKCAVPSGTTSGNVTMTTPMGTSNGKLFTLKPPTITAIAPTTGTIGTIVTITGKYFGPTQGTSSVSFNGTAVTSYTSWTDTSIKCVVPSGTSTGNVTVTTPIGTSNGKPFTLKPPAITAIAPTTGTIGTIVTITGKYFGPTQGASSGVSFNGTAVTSYTSWTDTSIKCVVPSGTTTGNVTVTTPIGTYEYGKLFTLKPPAITAIAPTSGKIGTIVTITGKYFGPTQGASPVSSSMAQR